MPEYFTMPTAFNCFTFAWLAPRDESRGYNIDHPRGGLVMVDCLDNDLTVFE